MSPNREPGAKVVGVLHTPLWNTPRPKQRFTYSNTRDEIRLYPIFAPGLDGDCRNEHEAQTTTFSRDRSPPSLTRTSPATSTTSNASSTPSTPQNMSSPQNDAWKEFPYPSPPAAPTAEHGAVHNFAKILSADLQEAEAKGDKIQLINNIRLTDNERSSLIAIMGSARRTELESLAETQQGNFAQTWYSGKPLPQHPTDAERREFEGWIWDSFDDMFRYA